MYTNCFTTRDGQRVVKLILSPSEYDHVFNTINELSDDYSFFKNDVLRIMTNSRYCTCPDKYDKNISYQIDDTYKVLWFFPETFDTFVRFSFVAASCVAEYDSLKKEADNNYE